MIDAAAEVAALLEACPRLDLVVTSRERLRIGGEQVYSVPVLARGDSQRLFVARAQAALPEFRAGRARGRALRAPRRPAAGDRACGRTHTAADDGPAPGAARETPRPPARRPRRRGPAADAARDDRVVVRAPERRRAGAARGSLCLPGRLDARAGRARLRSGRRGARVPRRQEPRPADRLGAPLHARDDPRVRGEQLTPERREELLRQLLDALADTFEAGNSVPRARAARPWSSRRRNAPTSTSPSTGRSKPGGGGRASAHVDARDVLGDERSRSAARDRIDALLATPARSILARSRVYSAFSGRPMTFRQARLPSRSTSGRWRLFRRSGTTTESPI